VQQQQQDQCRAAPARARCRRNAELAQLLRHDKANSALATIGRANTVSATRCSVCWNGERSPISGTNSSACFRAKPATAVFPRRRTPGQGWTDFMRAEKFHA
jgi:hypothetical protein